MFIEGSKHEFPELEVELLQNAYAAFEIIWISVNTPT